MTAEEKRELARKIVESWPPPTDQRRREITRIAKAHALRVRREQRRAA